MANITTVTVYVRAVSVLKQAQRIACSSEYHISAKINIISYIFPTSPDLVFYSSTVYESSKVCSSSGHHFFFFRKVYSLSTDYRCFQSPSDPSLLYYYTVLCCAI